MVRAIKNVYSRCCIVCASYKWIWNLQQKKTCSKKEIVTVNESKDGSDVTVEDEKKPDKVEEVGEADEQNMYTEVKNKDIAQ